MERYTAVIEHPGTPYRVPRTDHFPEGETVRGPSSFSVNIRDGNLVHSFSFRDQKIAEQFRELFDNYCLKFEMTYDNLYVFQEVKDEK